MIENEETTDNIVGVKEVEEAYNYENHPTADLPDSPPSCKLSDNDIDRLAEALLRRLKES